MLTTRKKLNSKSITLLVGTHASIPKEFNGALLFDGENFNQGALTDALFSTPLWGASSPVVLRFFLESDEGRSYLEQHIESLNTLDTPVLLVEHTLGKKDETWLEKLGVIITKEKKEVKKEYTPFAFAEKVADKDKKNAWIEFMYLISIGKSAEELVGTLIWQMKSIVLAKEYSPAESELSPFVYQKAKRAAMTTVEASASLSSLVSLLPTARKKGYDSLMALEYWLLKNL